MKIKKINFLLIFFILGFLLFGTTGSAVAMGYGSNYNIDTNNSTSCKPITNSEAKIKNVIVLVPDGCSQSIETLARWYSGKPLELDNMIAGTVSTYSSDSVITDSSSAATAFATGYKTTNGFISVGPSNESVLSILEAPPEELQYKPLATVLEASKLKGKSTGLVVTVRASHATPAAFAAHVDDRDNETEIIEQMVYENIDVVFGGGSSYLIPVSEGGVRTDGENLTKVLLDRGYQYVDNKDKMMKLTSGKTWGVFAPGHMASDINRPYLAPDQPSLEQMTGKAIDLLSQNKKGFFLMVEGSQIDGGGHANDPIFSVTEFLAFDKAVKVAVDFAKKDGHTLVLVFPDHNTGGMSIGSYSDLDYMSTSVEDVIGPLKGMKLNSIGVASKIGKDRSPENIKAQIKTWWGINATDDDVAEILELYNNSFPLDYALSKVISKNHTVISWTTNGHEGSDVPFWDYGPNRLTGHVDNTEIAKYIAKEMGFDLNETSSRLFVEAGDVFSKDNGDGKLANNEYMVDMTNSSNPVLRIGNSELPVDKNILVKNGVTHELDGIVVYAPVTDKVYIPAKAISLVNKTTKTKK